MHRPYDHNKYLKGNYANSLLFAPVSSADVEEIIFSLRNKPGNTNTFSISVLKIIRRRVSHVLCHIINLSSRFGIFPDCLKLSRVTSAPKGGESTNAGNCRPISVLPVFSIIFEQPVYKQLYPSTRVCHRSVIVSIIINDLPNSSSYSSLYYLQMTVLYRLRLPKKTLWNLD